MVISLNVTKSEKPHCVVDNGGTGPIIGLERAALLVLAATNSLIVFFWVRRYARSDRQLREQLLRTSGVGWCVTLDWRVPAGDLAWVVPSRSGAKTVLFHWPKFVGLRHRPVPARTLDSSRGLMRVQL